MFCFSFFFLSDSVQILELKRMITIQSIFYLLFKLINLVYIGVDINKYLRYKFDNIWITFTLKRLTKNTLHFTYVYIEHGLSLSVFTDIYDSLQQNKDRFFK